MRMKAAPLGKRTSEWPRSWDFEGSYAVGSFTFRFRTNVSVIGPTLDRLLSPFRTDRSNGSPVYSVVRTDQSTKPFSLFKDDTCINLVDNPASLLNYVLSHASSEALRTEKDSMVIHAGAASLGGKGVVLPAPPDHGKTTTVAGLVRWGFDYLSDEAAFIDPGTGYVLPFPRPLAMHARSIDAISRLRDDLPDDHPAFKEERNHVLPEVIRPGAVGTACRVRFVIAPKYGAGSATSLEPIGRAEAIKVLVENSFNFEHFGAQGLRILRTVVEGADCYRIRIGELDAAVRIIADLFEGK